MSWHPNWLRLARQVAAAPPEEGAGLGTVPVRELVAAIDRVRELHRPVIDDSWRPPGHCRECWDEANRDYMPWPCPTIRALEGRA